MRIARRFVYFAFVSALYVPSMPAQSPVARGVAEKTDARPESTTVRRSLEMDDLLN